MTGKTARTWCQHQLLAVLLCVGSIALASLGIAQETETLKEKKRTDFIIIQDDFFMSPLSIPRDRLPDDKYVGDPRIMPGLPRMIHNLQTGEPIVNPDWAPARYLNKDVMTALYHWRNEHGAPWSTAVYEKPFSEESLYWHATRWAIGVELVSSYISDELMYEIIDMAGVKWERPEPGSFFTGYGDYGVDFRTWHAKISEYCVSGMGINSDIGEMFAWYTAPSYVKGSLPENFEKMFELMATGKDPGLEKHLQYDDDSYGVYSEEYRRKHYIFLSPEELERRGKDTLRRRLPSLMKSLDRARRWPELNLAVPDPTPMGPAMESFLAEMTKRGEGHTILPSKEDEK